MPSTNLEGQTSKASVIIELHINSTTAAMTSSLAGLDTGAALCYPDFLFLEFEDVLPVRKCVLAAYRQFDEVDGVLWSFLVT